MKDERKVSEGYAKLARELIKEMPELEHIEKNEVKIIYLSSDLEKKSGRKKIYGECEKVTDKYKWAIDADFTITVFEPNVQHFNDEQLKVLMFHELLHVGTNGGMHVRPHNVEDFREIISRYGVDWAD